MSEANEIYVLRKKEDYPITPNVKIKDLTKIGISRSNLEVIIASKCFKRISERKNEIFEGLDNGDFKGLETRQYELRQFISTVIFDSGYGKSWSEEELNRLITGVLTDVLRYFSHLTTQEVGIAFYRGCREEYGEFYGLSTKIFYSWLKSYVSKSKIEANKELKKIDVLKEVISEEEILRRENRWLKTMGKEFNYFVETGVYDIYDIGNLLYNYLDKNKLISFTKEEKKQIMEEAKLSLKRNDSSLRLKDKHKKIEYLEIIDKMDNKKSTAHNLLIAESKHIALKKHLTQMKDIIKSFDDFWKETKETTTKTKTEKPQRN